MEDDEEIDLKDVFSMLMSNIKLIVICTLIFSILGVIYIKFIKVAEYTSSATLILVSSRSSTYNDGTMTNSAAIATDLNVNSKLVSTYSDLIKTKTVLRKVEENLGIDPNYEDTLRKNISVTSKDDTELISISVTDTNQETAYKVAKEITKVFADEVEQIYNINNVHIVDEAEFPESPSNGNNLKEILIFAIIGIVVAIAYIFLKNALDTTVKDEEEIEKICSSHVLATIPEYNTKMVKGGRK